MAYPALSSEGWAGPTFKPRPCISSPPLSWLIPCIIILHAHVYFFLLPCKLEDAAISSCTHEQIPTRPLAPCFAQSRFSLSSPNAIMQWLFIEPLLWARQAPWRKACFLPSWSFSSGQGDRHKQTNPQTNFQWHSVTTFRKKEQGSSMSSRGAYFRLGGGVRLRLSRDIKSRS